MIRRNLPPFLAFVMVCFIGAVLVYITDHSCDVIVEYNLTILSLLFSLFKSGFIFFVGIVLFLLIRKKFNPQTYKRSKLIYFSILPLFVFCHQFLLIPVNILNREVESSLCAKSTANGMTTESKDLNLAEYNYLKNKLSFLPGLPSTSERINISFYHDDFLGDFDLRVDFVCGIIESIDTSNKHWSVQTVDKFNGTKVVEYNNSSD